jgi:hypothetical protein
MRSCATTICRRNTVYRDVGDGLRPFAFIDWDIAAPGSRIHDVAHVCWQYVVLGPESSMSRRVRGKGHVMTRLRDEKLTRFVMRADMTGLLYHAPVE